MGLLCNATLPAARMQDRLAKLKATFPVGTRLVIPHPNISLEHEYGIAIVHIDFRDASRIVYGEGDLRPKSAAQYRRDAEAAHKCETWSS